MFLTGRLISIHLHGRGSAPDPQMSRIATTLAIVRLIPCDNRLVPHVPSNANRCSYLSALKLIGCHRAAKARSCTMNWHLV
jgi:hypothetical protein